MIHLWHPSCGLCLVWAYIWIRNIMIKKLIKILSDWTLFTTCPNEYNHITSWNNRCGKNYSKSLRDYTRRRSDECFTLWWSEWSGNWLGLGCIVWLTLPCSSSLYNLQYYSRLLLQVCEEMIQGECECIIWIIDFLKSYLHILQPILCWHLGSSGPTLHFQKTNCI